MDDLISRQAAISALCNACGKIDCDKMDKCEKLQLPPANCSEFPNSSDCISRQAAIDTEGLEEEIRCEMCKNPMHTDRGCDGHCKYDEKLYEKIMQILNERIKPLLSAQYISQQAVTESDLIDWYINSVDESEPVWTEEHIYELFNDFYLIPKED